MVPLTHIWVNPTSSKQAHRRINRFCTAHPCTQHTDHAIRATSVALGCICAVLHVHTMRPNYRRKADFIIGLRYDTDLHRHVGGPIVACLEHGQHFSLSHWPLDNVKVWFSFQCCWCWRIWTDWSICQARRFRQHCYSHRWPYEHHWTWGMSRPEQAWLFVTKTLVDYIDKWVNFIVFMCSGHVHVSVHLFNLVSHANVVVYWNSWTYHNAMHAWQTTPKGRGQSNVTF